HESVAERSPFRPTAVAEKVTDWPMSTVVPVPGAVIVTCGACDAAEPVMLTTIESDPVMPDASAAYAVITCVPRARLAVLKVEPVPIWPFRFENHLMRALTSPSMLSIAEPWKAIAVPAGTLAPVTGCRIVTAGGVLPIAIVMVCVAVRPSLSVTEAVMMWRPEVMREAVMVPPVPRRPATFDVHLIRDERSPSLKSCAVPLKLIEPDVE